MRLPSVRILSIVGAMVALGAALPVSTQAAGGVTLRVQIGSCDLWGSSESEASLVIKLKNPDGSVRSSFTASVSEHGSWSGCFPGTTVRAGDTVVAGRAGKTLQKVTVPDLRIGGDRVSDVLSGRGPAGLKIEASALDCGLVMTGGCYVRATRTVTIPADGTWTRDVTSDTDLLGGHRAMVTWWSADHARSVSRQTVVPFVSVTIGSATIKGATTVGSVGHVTVRTKDGASRGTMSDSANTLGELTGTLTKNGGAAIVRLGDKITSDVSPDVGFTASAAILFLPGPPDAVAGGCLPHAAYLFRMHAPSGGGFYWQPGKANGDGVIMIPDILSEHSGWKATLICQTPDGDQVTRKATLP